MPTGIDKPILVPVWLLWAQALCILISVVGAIVHYNLRTTQARKVKHALKRLFVAAARENNLERMRRGCKVVESAIYRVSDGSWARIGFLSACLTVFYFFVSFVVSGGFSVDWRGIAAAKARIEREAEPTLYQKTPAQVERARKQNCKEIRENVTVCTPAFDDAEARDIRDRIDKFEKAYPHLVSASRDHTVVTMLTLWKGTYLDESDRFPLLLFLGLNIVIDLMGLIITVRVASALAAKSSALRTISMGFIIVLAGITLPAASIASYEAADGGDFWGAAGGLEFIAGLLLLAGIVFVVRTVGLDFDSGKDALWFLWGMAGGLLMAANLVVYGLGHLTVLHIPALHLRPSVGWFFYLIAFASVVPTVLSIGAVLCVMMMGSLTKLLMPMSMGYLKAVWRMPAPILITLTAAPAAVVTSLVSFWPNLHRMFGLP